MVLPFVLTPFVIVGDVLVLTAAMNCLERTQEFPLLAGFPSLVLLTHTVATRAIAGGNRSCFVREEHSMSLVSGTGCNGSVGRSAVQLSVYLHPTVAAQQAGSVARIKLTICA